MEILFALMLGLLILGPKQMHTILAHVARCPTTMATVPAIRRVAAPTNLLSAPIAKCRRIATTIAALLLSRAPIIRPRRVPIVLRLRRTRSPGRTPRHERILRLPAATRRRHRVPIRPPAVVAAVLAAAAAVAEAAEVPTAVVPLRIHGTRSVESPLGELPAGFPIVNGIEMHPLPTLSR